MWYRVQIAIDDSKDTKPLPDEDKYLQKKIEADNPDQALNITQEMIKEHADEELMRYIHFIGCEPCEEPSLREQLGRGELELMEEELNEEFLDDFDEDVDDFDDPLDELDNL